MKYILDISGNNCTATQFIRVDGSKGFLFQKKLTTGEIEKNENGSYQFDISPEDTDSLRVGKYVFDIEIIGDRLKQTTIGNLVLTNEVTTIENEV